MVSIEIFNRGVIMSFQRRLINMQDGTYKLVDNGKEYVGSAFAICDKMLDAGFDLFEIECGFASLNEGHHYAEYGINRMFIYGMKYAA